MPATPLLRVSVPDGTAKLSPAQKKFNALVLKVEAQKKLLASWNESIELFRQRYARDIVPLLDQLDGLKAGLARFLDQRVDAKGFNEMDREAMRMVIRELVLQVMNDRNQEEMKALYNRNSSTDLDSAERERQEDPKSTAEDAFGIGMGAECWPDSPQEMLQKLEAEMLDEQAQREAERQAGRAKHRAARKPTARQTKEQAEADGASRSMRDVFRKLASSLHPDRETDPAERERKTGLMQRVNQAYARKDLLAMLQLQLESEQIGQAAIDTLAEARLRHFNRVLDEQSRELRQEIAAIEFTLGTEFGLDPLARIAPASLPRIFRGQMQQLQYEIHQLTRQPRALEDMKTLKQWLKQQRSRAREQEAFDARLRDFF